MAGKRICPDRARLIEAEIAAGVPRQAIARRYAVSATTCKSIQRTMQHDAPVPPLAGYASAALMHDIEQAFDYVRKVGFHLRGAELLGVPKAWTEDFRTAMEAAKQTETALRKLDQRFRKLIAKEAKK
ncbi:hypothetical protein [Rosistilla oblonga]|uniref:hypothetical protein n=1 Tax=Rosistilla oblonga TaxID=2527990 RepID=UPI003A9864BC